MLFVSAATASAVSFTFGAPVGATGPGGTILPGDSVTMDLFFDTETENLQAFFLQVNHAGTVASAAAIEPFIFVGGVVGTPLGAPVPNSAAGGNATGQFVITVGAPGSFAPGSGLVKFGSISLDTVAAGTLSIDISEAGGAVGGPGGQDLVAAGLVTFDSITVVPEPTTALLVGLGLVGLGVAGRRK
jgi:hypothetical protein